MLWAVSGSTVQKLYCFYNILLIITLCFYFTLHVSIVDVCTLQAMTQERRRYGFVLERQCSLAKHYLAYHTAGMNMYQAHLDNWGEIAKSREYLPENVETMFASRLRVSIPYYCCCITLQTSSF